MTNQPVTLKQIVEATDGRLAGDGHVPVTDVTHDSRQAGPGSLFVAVRGGLFDAHKFAPQVIAQGAVGVISELEPSSELLQGSDLGATAWIQVENVRRAMALAAAEIHHHPSRELQLVGITGTNGKTTTAYLVASIPEAAGEPVARALAIFLAFFWLTRLAAGMFVFNVRPYLTNWFYRLGNAAINLVFVYLTTIYAWTALKGTL